MYKLFFLASDTFLVNVIFVMSLFIRFEGIIPNYYWSLYKNSFLMLTIIYLVFNILFKLYRYLLRYINTREIMLISITNILSTTIFYLYGIFLYKRFPKSVYLIYASLMIVTMVFTRLSYKIVSKMAHALAFYHLRSSGMIKRTLLVGAGDAASIIISEWKRAHLNKRDIILAVDDNPRKIGAFIQGIPICGPIKAIPKLVLQYRIQEIIIAVPSADKQTISTISSICSKTKCKVSIFPGIKNAFTNKTSIGTMRPIDIEDLLGREEIVLDTSAVSTQVHNQTILVTGGGGSIGSELCRQIASFHPRHLIIFDIYENNAYDIQNELLQNGFPKEKLSTIIGSVRDQIRLETIFECYHPDIIFHAAAHKHVPLMEDSPGEAFKNNVFGTLNVAICAKRYKSKKMVLISTDKAVNPTNVMGATKRICEMIIQGISHTTSSTEFVAVRFGNVLGSNGSVIPLFKKQLAAGGPLTVTHRDIIRYFMTIPEAVRLILQAMTFAKGGEIFVLDMGQPVKILDLAENFIRLSGFEPYKDIPIEFTGLRPGEKLYEELLMAEEGLRKTSSDKIFVAKPSNISFTTLTKKLASISHLLDDPILLKQKLCDIVSTYHPIDSAMQPYPSKTGTEE